MKSTLAARLILTMAIASLITTACTAIPPREPVELAIKATTFAILPAETPVENTSQPAPLTRAQLDAGALVLDTLLADHFKSWPNVRIINQGQQEGVTAAATGSRLALARKIGTQLQVDGVLMTSIYRYRLRDGSNYSVDQPASVAFELKLVGVESGQTLCSMVFDETQQPLFDNIFSFSRAAGRNFRWVTAEELAAEGLAKKLADCVYLVPPRQPAP